MIELAPAGKPTPNMTDYAQAYTSFHWKDVEKEFSWHQTGKVNMAYEAVDRHCQTWRKDKTALLFVGDDREESYTFDQIRILSNKLANVLKKLGINRGDRVFVFMPRCPELYISIIGISKVAAIVGPLFEAFMEEGLQDRLADSGAVAIITTAELKNRIPRQNLPALKHIIALGAQENLQDGEVGFEAEMDRAPEDFEMEWVDREHPLILHYTSGSTGKPKGVLHVHDAMIGHYQTAKWVLDLKDADIYWCTADPGWATGTSYGVYGPWLNGVTSLVRGGRFDPKLWYSTIEKYRVTVWYSAPTAFRRLMAAGDGLAGQFNLRSLRLISSVGEPLNPVVIRWAQKVLGLPIHDTWWMTESGMHLIANYPSLPIKPGSMGKPFPGVIATILDDDGHDLRADRVGNLAIQAGWPSMMRQIWGNENRYNQYFRFNNWFISGDSAYRDRDGYYWFQARVDDVIKTSGERVGPFEVESTLLEHPAVVEAGVIGKPDEMRGQVIKAFVCPREGLEWTELLKKDIMNFVRERLAAHAVPREIEFRCGLPKTRSGKIMRRVLKAWDLGLPPGDISCMDDSLDFRDQGTH